MSQETHIQLTNNMVSSRTFDDWVKIWDSANKKVEVFAQAVNRIEQLEKREIRYIDQINRLQEACMPQLTENMKLDMINWMTEKYGSKAFKTLDVRDEFEKRGYGCMSPIKAIDSMVKNGGLTYKRGWYHIVFSGKSQSVVNERKDNP